MGTDPNHIDVWAHVTMSGYKLENKICFFLVAEKKGKTFTPNTNETN